MLAPEFYGSRRVERAVRIGGNRRGNVANCAYCLPHATVEKPIVALQLQGRRASALGCAGDLGTSLDGELQ
jgi:hypothetical protein